ncbi:MAG: glycosyltransferase [Duncaniella sp.]|nr:glycosyltransferase [Duncaniella sp.]
MKRILFYSDTLNVGGHELMALQIYRAIKERYNVIFIVSKKNRHFQEILKSDGCNFYTINHCSNRGEIIRSLVYTDRKLIALIREISPDLVISLQGNIEISFGVIKAAKSLGIPVWSYIPLCQPLSKVSSNKLIGRVKDGIRKRLYAGPDGFITISSTQASYLKQYGIREDRVIILQNHIDVSNLIKNDKQESRRNLGLTQNSKLIGYIGRFEPWHKGLDKFIEFLEGHAGEYPEFTFVFVGDGPLKQRIDQLAKAHGNIKIINWLSDLSEVYSSLDFLIMPSRYEGVSLTMLEGAFFGIPVIANKIPEFQEYIPETNLFDINKSSEFSEILKKCAENDVSPIQFDNRYADFNEFRRSSINTFEKILALIDSHNSVKSYWK